MSLKDKFSLINIPEEEIKKVWGVITNGHELMNTLSEYNRYAKFLNNWRNKRIERKCEKFLEGLAMKVFSNEQFNSEDVLKLEKTLKKNGNQELVFDILEEATKTVSDNAAKILGIIAGQVLIGNRSFNYNDWILVNGLKNMNDWDLENLKKVYLYFEAYPHEEYVNSACVYLNLPMYEYSDTTDPVILNIVNDEDFQMFKSSIMRINSLQILSNGAGLMDDDATSLRGNRAGDELYELIKVTGV
ncbi:TPA: hypothetical protein ACGXMA_004084 [Bacillus cereus]|uniref:hypothetical protein n=1 Tax=Bacillus cereus TaxID=1396 RepID=UPI001F1E409F|nr:hypothetical protein [Bacillus cereus]MCE7034537.1 hypothetical protein [Bacillus cereus]